MIQEWEGNLSLFSFWLDTENVVMKREQTKIKKKDFMEAKNIVTEWKFILEIIKENWISDFEHNLTKIFSAYKEK